MSLDLVSALFPMVIPLTLPHCVFSLLSLSTKSREPGFVTCNPVLTYDNGQLWHAEEEALRDWTPEWMCLVWHGRSHVKHPQEWQSPDRSREAAMWPEEQTVANYKFKYQQHKPIKQGERQWLGRGWNSLEQNKQRTQLSSASSHGVGKA